MSADQDDGLQDELPDDFDELDDDFSLDKLSKAYADVIRQRANDGDQTVGATTDAMTSNGSPSSESNLIPAHGSAGATSPTSKDPADAEAGDSVLQDDNRGCVLEATSIIEAIVFVGAPRDKPLTLASIASVLRDVGPEEVLAAIGELNAAYREQNAAYQIVVIDSNSHEDEELPLETDSSGDRETASDDDADNASQDNAPAIDEDAEVKMVLADGLREFSDDYYGRNKQVQLSQATIDVLAVVAYNQPISKSEVETTRGKPSGAVLAQLVRRDLLALVVSETKPVTRHYETTQRFLDLFQLANVEDLPQSHDVSEFEEYID